jgi:hypothetical protein
VRWGRTSVVAYFAGHTVDLGSMDYSRQRGSGSLDRSLPVAVCSRATL